MKNQIDNELSSPRWNRVCPGREFRCRCGARENSMVERLHERLVVGQRKAHVDRSLARCAAVRPVVDHCVWIDPGREDVEFGAHWDEQIGIQQDCSGCPAARWSEFSKSIATQAAE